jgi:hypothetical protein
MPDRNSANATVTTGDDGGKVVVNSADGKCYSFHRIAAAQSRSIGSRRSSADIDDGKSGFRAGRIQRICRDRTAFIDGDNDPIGSGVYAVGNKITVSLFDQVVLQGVKIIEGVVFLLENNNIFVPFEKGRISFYSFCGSIREKNMQFVSFNELTCKIIREFNVAITISMVVTELLIGPDCKVLLGHFPKSIFADGGDDRLFEGGHHRSRGVKQGHWQIDQDKEGQQKWDDTFSHRCCSFLVMV